MDQTIRNKLRGVVTQCRKLLEDSTAQALQGRFGIYAARKKGEVQIEDEARMAHLTEEDRACRQDLLDHLEHIQAIGYKPSEALEQLVREIAFTHLNRICAYKMMESRGLIREAVSRGLKSQGFFFYLSDHPEDEKLHNGGGQETAYRNFLDWLGGTLSQEIGVLFNPNEPANRIYPAQRVLDAVLALINDGDLKNIWSQDETIGWVYQYFTPKELRDKVRKESQAPRNSYELAFRNQFFTPRYVVEFLTDNTLGRIWYEMRKGKTILKDRCKYLVRRPTEMFLKEGETPPAESKDVRENLSQEELLKQPVYIPHRPKKDPRELKALDPACGSGHFLLYCFDLLQVIYEEAYDDPDLSAAIRRDYPAIDDLRRAVPGLILKHNLHGIDIDLRATQIAALALWLRCQRAYRELGLKNGDRPKITRSNIVCAEPMPGEEDIRQEFIQGLDDKLGQLVSHIFNRMKLAGEAGSLLKIEEDIGSAIREIYGQYGEMFREGDEQRWLKAEADLLAALRSYSQETENGRGFRRKLFAEDAEQGFAFVDLCRKKYDVMLMNPPFGEPTPNLDTFIRSAYLDMFNDIYAAFGSRALSMLNSEGGYLGVITSKTFFYTKRLREYRQLLRQHPCSLKTVVDFGLGVLDATVETACYTVGKNRFDSSEKQVSFFDLTHENVDQFGQSLLSTITDNGSVVRALHSFEAFPFGAYAYWAPPEIVRLFEKTPTFEPHHGDVVKGLTTFDDFRFVRLRWEIPEASDRWLPIAKGGGYGLFYAEHPLLVDWLHNGKFLQEHEYEHYETNARTTQSKSFWFKKGLTFSEVSSIGFSTQPWSQGRLFGGPGFFVCPKESEKLFMWLAFFNSNYANSLLTLCSTDRHWSCLTVGKLPVPVLSDTDVEILQDSGKACFDNVRAYGLVSETSGDFTLPILSKALRRDQTLDEISEREEANFRNLFENVCFRLQQIDETIATRTGFSPDQLGKNLKAYDHRSGLTSIKKSPLDSERLIGKEGLSRRIVGFTVGCSVGRWDIRFSTGERQPQKLPDPFDPLPICPPGMLQGPDGLPAKPEHVPSDYPLRIDWDGILVDDPGHEDDIIRRVQDVLEVIWKDRAEAIEREACEILGVRELRDYFRKPGNGGFWMDHVKRYSKSRRKAPIYWYLRSAKGNYGLWLYYHRLDKDILFKALLNYVEPKLRMEEDRLKSLRGRKEEAGSSGREAKQIEKDIDRQDQLVSELHDFADKLRRAANLHLVPDLNDGVVLTIAPLFELVPWKEAKEYWEDLVAGDYEWSSIGKQMREKGLVKK
jgi:hypothetical protein